MNPKCEGCGREAEKLTKMLLLSNGAPNEIERCADCLEVARAMLAAGVIV
jgi:hypothetical protein